MTTPPITFEVVDKLRDALEQKYAAIGPAMDAAIDERIAEHNAKRLAELRSDPEFIAYGREQLARLERGQHRYVTNARDVWGERQMFLASLLMFGGVDEKGQPLAPHALRYITSAMQIATPFLWNRDLYLMATESKMPKHVISRTVLPLPLMWWTFTDGLTVGLSRPGTEDAVTTITYDAVLIGDSGPGANFAFIGTTPEENTMVAIGSFIYGDTYDPEAYGGVGSILSALSFLASPYVTKTRRTTSRQEQRRAGRAHSSLEQAEVNIVDLRPVQARKVEPSEEGGTRQYHHRWVVRGHHRAQWYPSEGAHHVIWVAPYVKGPDGAPYADRLYRVRR